MTNGAACHVPIPAWMYDRMRDVIIKEIEFEPGLLKVYRSGSGQFVTASAIHRLNGTHRGIEAMVDWFGDPEVAGLKLAQRIKEKVVELLMVDMR